MLTGLRGGNCSSHQDNTVAQSSKHHSPSDIWDISIGRPTIGSFDNSQRQAKYYHLRCLASLNIYSRIIDLPSLGVGLRSVHSLQWALHKSPDTELEPCHFVN